MADRNKSKNKAKNLGRTSAGRINDGLPVTMSRQQRYQIRQRLAGKCINCPRLRKNYSHRCDQCEERRLSRVRIATVRA